MEILLAGLKDQREAAGLTQQELATASDLSVGTIFKHEQGATNGIDGKTLQALANALRCEKRDLFFSSNSDTSGIKENQ